MLYVVWAYSNHLYFGNKLPLDIINLPHEFYLKDWSKKGIYLWNLEIVIKDAIIESKLPDGHAKKSAKDYKHFKVPLNELTDFSNELAKLSVGDKTIVLRELFRIAHQQFPHQVGSFYPEFITRYFKIYQYETIGQIVLEKTGLSLQSIFLTGFAIVSAFREKSFITYPLKVDDIPELDAETVEKFLSLTCKDFEDIQTTLSKERVIDKDYLYHFHSLIKYPLIKINGANPRIECPIVDLLMRRFTSGLYYELYNEKGFDQQFGQAFEHYTKEVAGHSYPSQIIDEQSFSSGRGQKQSSDFFICDDTAVLFVECKTKRLSFDAKTKLYADEVMENQMGILADAVVQTYKSIIDWRSGDYPDFPGDSRQAFPLIVTLEDWFLFDRNLLTSLNEKVSERLNTAKTSTSFLANSPFTICSIYEFEKAIPVIKKVGIKSFFSTKNSDSNFRDRQLLNFVQHKYKEELSGWEFPFAHDFKKIFPWE